MSRRHTYTADVVWTGNRGEGTSSYRAYGRDHEIRSEGKAPILGSSDPHFRGDAARWNPEETLVASLSACHQLWYLHLCAVAGVVVTAYEDRAEGVMLEEDDGAGQFERVTLRPRVTITAASDAALAARLHHDAHAKCFVARSVNFEVACEPAIVHAVATPAP
jgi:organic hydroperoxide reductase OsmC/OhrA